jgi:oligosaccharide repeat unit polymerase
MIYRRPSFIFLVVYLLMLFFAVAPVYQSDITNELRDNINAYGIWFHFLSIISFLIGAHAASFSYKYSAIQERFFVFRKKRFNILIYSYCFIGLFVVLWQISISISPKDYLNELISYILLQKEMPKIRSYFLLDRESGGLDGIIKMFSYLPLSALFIVLTYGSIRSDRQRKIINLHLGKYIFIIFIIIALRSLFTLDRAVLLFFFILMIYYLAFNRQIKPHLFKKPIYYIPLLIVFVFLYFLSVIRQGKGFLGSLFEYSALGLANLSTLFEYDFDYTWGMSTFFVIYSTLERFGWQHIIPDFREAQWIWNPARYLTAYAYQDFGLLCVIFFILLGFLADRIYIIAYHKSNPYALVILFPLLIAIAGSIGVPAFRGPEWWVSLLMGIVGVKLCFKRSNMRSFPKRVINT